MDEKSNPGVDAEAARVNLERQLRKVIAEHATEPNAPGGYWRGVRIGLETAINVLADKDQLARDIASGKHSSEWQPKGGPKITMAFAMPSKHTFSIKPIAELLDRYPADPMHTIDPFCGESTRAYYRNDIAEHKMLATDFLDWCIKEKRSADLVLLDPPYSPTQIKRAYEGAGLPVSATDTQNARLYKDAREKLDKLLVPGGIAISCGWNTAGFGKGYELLEVLIVNHGGAHHDTLVTVERKLPLPPPPRSDR